MKNWEMIYNHAADVSHPVATRICEKLGLVPDAKWVEPPRLWPPGSLNMPNGRFAVFHNTGAVSLVTRACSGLDLGHVVWTFGPIPDAPKPAPVQPPAPVTITPTEEMRATMRTVYRSVLQSVGMASDHALAVETLYRLCGATDADVEAARRG